MRAMFTPQLVNEPFGDPGLYVDFNLRNRALLFDLGELVRLAPKKLLRVSDVFVSHTHMDHFAGFDHLLRLCLGRPTAVRLYGPPGFVGQVEHKLGAYTWNLVDNYPGDFSIEAWETDAGWHATGARFRCRCRFTREALPPREFTDGVLRDEPSFRVRAAFLDHGIPCLGFSLEEKVHVNVWKNRLAELGLPVGPWLKALKDAVARGDPDDTPVAAPSSAQGDRATARVFPLGFLKSAVLQLVPGEKLGYFTDLAFTHANVERIVAIAQAATQLFIECTFLDEDAAQAASKKHLTARQAGEIARRARAKRLVPFHFSPRYADREAQLRSEAQAAWAGSPDAPAPAAAAATRAWPSGATR